MMADTIEVAHSVEQLLDSLGIYTWRDDPHLCNSPQRVAEMWEYLLRGLYTPLPAMTTFPSEGRSQMVVSKAIPVRSLCAHHLLPFVGEAVVAYIPNKELLGLSKLSRFVDWCARRPQVQEKLTDMVAGGLTRLLFPADEMTGPVEYGVGVVIRARHMCMELRGVEHQSDVITSALTGAFLNDQEVRAEFLKLAGV